MCPAAVIHIPFQIGSATVLKINSSVPPLTAALQLSELETSPCSALRFNLHPQPRRLLFPLKAEPGIMALMKAAAGP